MNNIKLSNNNILHPNWITGFVDAEGCFTIKFGQSKSCKTGWFVQAIFQLNVHVRDKNLLLKIKSFFNEIGTIRIDSKNNKVCYRIHKINDINKIIIPHFENYPLITNKQSDFVLWKDIVKLINKDKDKYKNGITEIINIRASLNKGISDNLSIYFTNITKVKRSRVNIPITIDYDWFAGFFSGDGCFYIEITKSKTSIINYTVRLRALIGQHSRDELLIDALANILGYGTIYRNLNRNFSTFTVSNFKDIYNKLIPMFSEDKIEGIKSLDFKDFCLAAELINKKSHLTLEGINEIMTIKSRMNLARY
jgi:hypothetical protein